MGRPSQGAEAQDQRARVRAGESLDEPDRRLSLGVVERLEYVALDELGDPDDYRVDSELAVVVDPGGGREGSACGLAMIAERIGPGERIPLHTHPIDEAIVIESGQAEIRLGDTARTVREGAVVFVPAGIPHGTTNTGERDLRLRAVFPSSQIGIRYLERNPALGPEDANPQPAFSVDLRELAPRGRK